MNKPATLARAMPGASKLCLRNIFRNLRADIRVNPEFFMCAAIAIGVCVYFAKALDMCHWMCGSAFMVADCMRECASPHLAISA
ncbi:hypothetical protein [Comamonas kerstersii]|uniref:hypothetical protein n=1 Tax=Comamonas kerstersii TaxID=225992 RepID=UPI001B3281BE|nr:hypothetical protein [Comamonas kerstersii]QTW20402.1 hypothetical protein H8N02_08365 [Comamonas kerstersii]